MILVLSLEGTISKIGGWTAVPPIRIRQVRFGGSDLTQCQWLRISRMIALFSLYAFLSLVSHRCGRYNRCVADVCVPIVAKSVLSIACAYTRMSIPSLVAQSPYPVSKTINEPGLLRYDTMIMIQTDNKNHHVHLHVSHHSPEINCQYQSGVTRENFQVLAPLRFAIRCWNHHLR